LAPDNGNLADANSDQIRPFLSRRQLAQKTGVFPCAQKRKKWARTQKHKKSTMTSYSPIEVIDPTPLKKRKTKDLPSVIASLTEANFRHSLKTRIETDPKESGEVMVAFAVEVAGVTVDLTSLHLDQLRIFCKRVGVRYVNNCTKFQCRKALNIMANYMERREREDGVQVVDRTDSNIIRLANIVFSHEFVDRFLSLNDSKARVDHETGDMPSNFWEDVMDAMNGSDDDDSCALLLIIDDDNPHGDDIRDIDTHQFDLMTVDAIKKKVYKLLKVRAAVQKNMTLSGEHDSDAFNFVEVAMKRVGKAGLGLFGCYYFFMRCNEFPEIDVHFSQTLDTSVSGNTDDGPSPTNSGSAKKVAAETMADISNFSKEIAAEMKETNRLAQEANKLMKNNQIIQLAQHLEKTEMLEQMLASFSASSGSFA
jgi:hypothetical protein